MKNYFLLFLLLSVSLVGFSQDYWQHVYTTDTSSVNSLKVADDGTIYFGGAKGLYISHDGGLNWDFKYLFDYVWLNGLEFDTDSNLLVGASYLLYKYYIDQDSFAFIQTPPPLGDFSVIFADSIGIFTSCEYNQMYRYLDGEWSTIYIGDDVGNIYAIAKDTNGVLYIGAAGFSSGGGIFRSFDNGDTWEFFGLHHYYIRSLAIDSQNRLYAGAIGHVSTSEGGFFRYNYENLEWDTISHSARVQSLYFNEEDSLYAGIYSQGGNGGAWMSPDYGDTWIKISTGLPTITSNNVTDITDDSHGYLYAIVSNYRSIYKSADSTITSIAIQDGNSERELLVYPNPFQDSFSINYSEQKLHSIASAHLYSLSGNEMEITVQKKKNNCISITPAHLIPEGIYFVVIKSGIKRYIQKVIKY